MAIVRLSDRPVGLASGMKTKWALLALVIATPCAAVQKLDAHFIANRVLVDAPLRAGGLIRFWSDTGGGATIIYDKTAARLKLATEPLAGELVEEMPPGSRQLTAPLPLAPSAFPTPPGPVLVTGDLVISMGLPADCDGNLGHGWFAGHIWTWDYPKGTLTLEDAGWQPNEKQKVMPIGFRPAGKEGPALHFPRIVITIDGEEVPMLLDTGASTVLTPEAAQAIDGGSRLRATSMIVADRIAAWRKAHPQWRVIEHAQGGTGARMIEVPDVRIAGFEVGPIWFTERPNKNFREMMSQSMNAPVEGAIGGNAFATLRMTVDYLHGRASFSQEKP